MVMKWVSGSKRNTPVRDVVGVDGGGKVVSAIYRKADGDFFFGNYMNRMPNNTNCKNTLYGKKIYKQHSTYK